MARGGEHHVVIQRRGRSHRARCGCGWNGHAWNELRPAEADAWHHVHGDSSIVDVPLVADPTDPTVLSHLSRPSRTAASVESLVNRARGLADGPSPYGRQAVRDLWLLSGGDRSAVAAAVDGVNDLMRRHSLHSASTADSEWLQLLTAKRLLREVLEQDDASSYR